jgi:amino acid transporter
MSRDGYLPAWIGRIHRERHTPANAALILGVLVAVVVPLQLLVSSGGILSAITDQASMLGSVWLLAYLATCAGGVVFGLRASTRSGWVAGLSLIGALGVVGVFGWGVTHAGGGSSSAAPWIAIAWTVVIAILFAARELRSSRVEVSVPAAVD